ncbi:MAG: polysaccharide deacetylase family protein [Flavobacteriaceae bacterium]|nr:polysaccharide deacetylase family protein [Flavobacteriaceae bacterium]
MIRIFKFIFFLAINVYSQSNNIAQRLGYHVDDKLLIIHADDIGVSHSVNVASFKAFKSESISSGSIMMPCPWVLEVAEFSINNPNYDLGLHLTITSEWKNYKWDGITSSNEIKSLLSNNYFYDNTNDIKKYADAEEIRKEIQSQIDFAKKIGINPTHLDSHMGALSVRPDIIKVYLEVGKTNRIPVFTPIQFKPLLEKINWDQSEIVWVDKYFMMNGNGVPEDKWFDFYANIISNIKSGLNVILVHLGKDNEELKAVTIDHPAFGSKWRSLDLKVLESQEFKDLLLKNNIKVINWRDIKRVLYP